MNILHVFYYNGDMANGINMVVPEYLRYQALNENVFLYNIGDAKYKENKQYKVYNKEGNILDIVDVESIDIVIFHSIYYIEYVRIGKKLKQRGVSYVLVPHSSLTIEAQCQKKIIKRIMNQLFFNKLIKNASGIHYLSVNEMEASKSFHHSNVWVIPNGINLSTRKWKYQYRSRFELIYIGRYAIYQKGIDILLEACYNIKEQMKERNIYVSMYGKDYENNKAKIKKMVDRYQLEDIVTVNDAVFGLEKEKKMSEADCFVLTSRFEGLPVSVLEALSIGIIPLLTVGTNFTNVVEKNDCGFVAEASVQSVSNQILNVYEHRLQLERMSENARKLISENYDWSSIAQQMIKKYYLILE